MKTLRLIAAAAVAASLIACGAGQVDDAAANADSADDATIAPQFQIFKGADGQFYFHLIAGNGQKVLASEGYTTQTSAKNGIASALSNGIIASRYEMRAAVDGSPYFVLKARNGAVLGMSQLYSSSEAATAGMNTVLSIIQANPLVVPAPTGPGFTVFKGLDGKFYFHLKADNGEIVLESQGYTTKASATNGVISAQSNGLNSARYQVREADDGDFYFVLKAANGQVIGVSELYVSQSNADRAVQSTIALVGELQ